MRSVRWAVVVVGLTTLVYPSASFTPAVMPFGVPTDHCARPSLAARGAGAVFSFPFLSAHQRSHRELILQHPRLKPPLKHGKRSLVVVQASDTVSNYIGDGFQSAADEGAWSNVCGGITTEMAEDCSVEEAAGIAGIIVQFMEACSATSMRLPRSTADVLQSLLSHPAGSQAFWTTFLTDPDLELAVQDPFQPALIRSMERFPELNIGVVSSCLAMSVTEEALFKEEGDEFMSQSAAVSKDRVLALIKSITRQPDAKRGMHGLNWMLDLIDYEALDMARSTVELRREDKERMSGQATSSFVEDRAKQLGIKD